jgi:hypothetical protein
MQTWLRDIEHVSAAANNRIWGVFPTSISPWDGGKNGGSPSKSTRTDEVAEPTKDLEISDEVHGRGLEPLRLTAVEPKSTASANSATRASCEPVILDWLLP